MQTLIDRWNLLFGGEQTRGVPHSRRVRCCAAGCLERAFSSGKEDVGAEGRGARGRDGGCGGAASPASGESNQTKSGFPSGIIIIRSFGIGNHRHDRGSRQVVFSSQFSRPRQDVFVSFVLMMSFMYTHIKNHQRGRYTQIRTIHRGESTSTLCFLSVCGDKQPAQHMSLPPSGDATGRGRRPKLWATRRG